MADINGYLAQILAAVYGEEVRGSIHDAIDAMNKESTQAMSDAATAKDSAKQSATAAAQSAQSASQSATSAASASSSAGTAAAAAEAAKTAAAASEKNAQTAATNSASSAASALASKNRAEEILTSVDGKVADVVAMKTNFIANHAGDDILLDSSGAEMLDSSGKQLIGRVVFADRNDISDLTARLNAQEASMRYFAGLLLESRMTNCEESIKRFKEQIILDGDELLDSDGDELRDNMGKVLIGTVISTDRIEIVQLTAHIEALETALKYVCSLLLESRMANCESAVRLLETHSLLDSNY